MEQTNKQQYTCTMHPEVVRDQPGKCPKCGMNLVPKESATVEKTHYHGHSTKHTHALASTNTEAGQYYCPMLCEGDKKYAQPGNCPVCGML
jgi:Cu+-exporting ATPase